MSGPVVPCPKEERIAELQRALEVSQERLDAAKRLLKNQASSLAGRDAVASVKVQNVIVNFEDKPTGRYLAFGRSGVYFDADQTLIAPLGWTLDQEDFDLACQLEEGRYTLAIVVFKEYDLKKKLKNKIMHEVLT